MGLSSEYTSFSVVKKIDSLIIVGGTKSFEKTSSWFKDLLSEIISSMGSSKFSSIALILVESIAIVSRASISSATSSGSKAKTLSAIPEIAKAWIWATSDESSITSKTMACSISLLLITLFTESIL